MLISFILATVGGFFLAFFFTFLLKRAIGKHGLFVTNGIPFIGGIAIGISFILTSLAIFFFHRQLTQGSVAILIASFAMLIFGLIDDRFELSILHKFFVQLLATAVLIFFGVRTQIVYIGNILNMLITAIWVLGITNAFNHLDVMDGVAAGTATVASLALLVIAITTGNVTVVMFLLTLLGALSTFLLYNLPPAKVYLGNAGSHFLGFILAAVALSISYAPMERKIALLSPIVILGLPIFDTAFLIFVRLLKSRSIFKKSNDHLALRFLEKGYSKNQALAAMLGLEAFFSFCGVMLSRVSNLIGVALIGLAIIFSFAIAARMGRVTVNE